MRAIWLSVTLSAAMHAAAVVPEGTGTAPGFATCAAYYFLAARGHGVRDYDRHYAAGEQALNEATRRHGRHAATRRMETVSGTMMREMRQDWREIARLDSRYGTACEALLRETGHAFE